MKRPAVGPWPDWPVLGDRVRPAMSASILARPDLVSVEEATDPSLTTASSRVFSTRWTSEVWSWTSRFGSGRPTAGRMSGRGHEAALQQPSLLGLLAQPPSNFPSRRVPYLRAPPARQHQRLTTCAASNSATA